MYEMRPLDLDDPVQLEQWRFDFGRALFYALTKVYDNYKTPLGSYVVCWKTKKDQYGLDCVNGWFIVGMTVNNLDCTQDYITMWIPMEWWDRFDCMQYPQSPVPFEYDGTQDIERLLRL
jgi:hypothetical protein